MTVLSHSVLDPRLALAWSPVRSQPHPLDMARGWLEPSQEPLLRFPQVLTASIALPEPLVWGHTCLPIFQECCHLCTHRVSHWGLVTATNYVLREMVPHFWLFIREFGIRTRGCLILTFALLVCGTAPNPLLARNPSSGSRRTLTCLTVHNKCFRSPSVSTEETEAQGGEVTHTGSHS